MNRPVLAIAVFLTLLTSRSLAEEASDPILEDIRALGLTGCVLLYDSETRTTIQYGDSFADSAFTPASTFKVPHALIALETGVVTDTTIFPWDGIERGWRLWDRDLGFADAIHYSAIHLFQQIAPKIGRERMQQWVDRFDYGNGEISGDIDLFWVDGGLRVTPRQQLDFLQQMVNGKLPVKQEYVDFVSGSMLITKGDGWTAHAKTGRAIRVLPQVGWYIGWVEFEERKPIYFATVLLDDEDGPKIKRPRLDLTQKALEKAGLSVPGLALPYY
ncbi:hypothetical protein KQI63_06980 [bacterium]|nr:hypothetical protein [bacterium]